MLVVYSWCYIVGGVYVSLLHDRGREGGRERERLREIERDREREREIERDGER